MEKLINLLFSLTTGVIEIDLKTTIREIPDFPKPGILFYDITTLLKNPEALKDSIEQMYNLIKDKQIDKQKPRIISKVDRSKLRISGYT